LAGGVYWDEVADEVVDEKVVPLDDLPVKQWSAANLTPAANGLGRWSVDELRQYLRSGHNARAGAFGPMIEVVANSTSQLTAADVTAMAVYLKDLAPDSPERSAPAPQTRLASGAAVYTARCGDCHQPTGLGMPSTGGAGKFAPPLAGNAVLQAPSPATLINVVLYGAHGGVLATQAGEAWPWPKMSGFELSVGLDDEQIAALCTYVRSTWGNSAGAVTAADVARQH
jgi:mono/diheme cytochrome c family protein